jgi:hypothetical protein
MDTIEEPQLFGAPADWVSGMTISTNLSPDGLRSVNLTGFVNNRHKPMWVSVFVEREGSLSPVIGKMMGLIIRCEHLSPSLMRRTFWAYYNALAAEGYAVDIRNCGTEPR